jgi:hypothetical protein
MNAKIVTLVGLALALAGCNGAFWGNLIVLALTVGIFFGTLALGRSRGDSTRSGAGASQNRA